MNPAQEAYDRLMAAQRYVSVEEDEDRKRESDREALNRRIRRKLPKGY